MTRDTDRAGAFLTGLFGWEAKVRDMGPMGRYTTFNRGEAMLCGMMQLGPEFGEIPPHWMGYIAVQDCDASAAKAGKLGAKVHVPPTDIPEVGRFSLLLDPTGAAVSVIALRM